MTWDDEKIKQLKKLWDKGLSTTEIAKKMNVSKNSVVGKVHRLCLKARPSPIKKKNEDLSANVETQEVLIEPAETIQNEVSEVAEIELSDEIINPVSDNENIVEKAEKPQDNEKKVVAEKKNCAKKSHKNLKLVELDSHTCRWPIGDPRDDDFCFCGKKVHAGQTYCDEHSQIAYVKAGLRK